jgi:hypothetical protein
MKSPKMETHGHSRKGVAEKTLVSDHSSESGSTDAALSSATSKLYKGAAANRGGGPVIKAIQER